MRHVRARRPEMSSQYVYPDRTRVLSYTPEFTTRAADLDTTPGVEIIARLFHDPDGTWRMVPLTPWHPGVARYTRLAHALPALHGVARAHLSVPLPAPAAPDHPRPLAWEHLTAVHDSGDVSIVHTAHPDAEPTSVLDRLANAGTTHSAEGRLVTSTRRLSTGCWVVTDHTRPDTHPLHLGKYRHAMAHLMDTTRRALNETRNP